MDSGINRRAGSCPRGIAGKTRGLELILHVVAIETPRSPGTAEPAQGILADAAILQLAAAVALHLQRPGARIMARWRTACPN